MTRSTTRRATRATKATKATRATRATRANKAFEKSLSVRLTGRYVLRLYVAGATDRSRQAILRARRLCEAELGSRFELQVIDVCQQPILARDGQIIATPTLVREFPKPVRRLIGNLSDTSRLFVGLNVETRGKTSA